MKTKILLISLLFLAIGISQAQERRFVLDPSLHSGDYAAATVVVKYRKTAATGARQAPPSPSTNATLRQLRVKEIKPLFAGIRKETANVYKPHSSATPVDLSTVYEVQLPTWQNLEQAINQFLADPLVEYAEPLYTNFQPMDVPNDPYADPLTGQQYWLKNIHAYEAWDVHKGTADVTIGIVDFGFDVTHDELKNKLQYNTKDPVDGIDNDKDGYIDNYTGWNIINNNHNLLGNPHGTRVAGCAAGEANNGIGMAGVAYNCRMMPVSGYDPATGRFSGFAGVVYLAEKGCKVINLSWGRTGPASALEQDVINYAAINHDVVLTISAGNDNTSQYWYPSSYNNVISVAASGPSDAKWASSTYNDKVDILAPGESIISSEDGNGYRYDSGTSYASPIVAGVAALVRSMYPNLSAAEVIQRIQATADDVYSLPDNGAYIGKLGSGRVNVYRALTESLSKSMALTNVQIVNPKNQPYLLSGTTNQMIVSLKNLAGSLNNAQCQLSSSSSYVTIGNETITMGAMATHAVFTNQTLPFTIKLNTATPVNTEVYFTLKVTDGTYQRSFVWQTFVNPDFLDIDVNQLLVTATSNGRIGYAYPYSFWDAAIATRQQAQGNGIQFQHTPLLFEAGLMVGTDQSHVSDCIRGSSKTFSKNEHFQSVQNIAYQTYPQADILVGGLLKEDPFYYARTGLQIQYQVYAWKDAPNDSYVIVEYKITNRSTKTLDSLYTSLFADWEIGTRQNNQADWDATRKLGYVYNPTGSYPYAGIRLLTEQTPYYYAFDNQGSVNIFDGFTMTEKFSSMSQNRLKTAAATDDVAHQLTARTNQLNVGDSVIVAFALIGGKDLATLQKAADEASKKFIELKRSPKPVVADVQVCKGGRAVITPTPGQNFMFYQSQENGRLQPMTTGKQLEIDNITHDMTVYVTNTDSLYESEPVPVAISLFRAAFEVNKDSLGISDQDTLKLTCQTTNAAQYSWDFGDGATSTDANPSHTYTKEGVYNVVLITQSTAGCQDTVVRKVQVFPGILSPEPIIQPVTICSGEHVVITPSHAKIFRFYNQAEKFIGEGKSFDAGMIVRDTLFYVTATDYVVESNPVEVVITVREVQADFTLSNDSLDLAFGEVLSLTDHSTNAVKWQWDFGDNSTDQTNHPMHTYKQEGVYKVRLTVENEQACTHSLTKTVHVVRSTDQLANGIWLSPNPTADIVTIQKNPLLHVDQVTVRVFDLTGHEIYRNDSIPSQLAIPLQRFGRGMYIFTFTGNNQLFTRRIVVH